MKKVEEVTQYTNLSQRMCMLLTEIKQTAEELETNDYNLVAHLLILDCIRYRHLKCFEGVEDRGGKKTLRG